MQSSPEIEIKLALARQVGDEAKHYKLIEKHLHGMNADLSGFNPADGGYGPMFQLLTGFTSTVERIGAAVGRRADNGDRRSWHERRSSGDRRQGTSVTA